MEDDLPKLGKTGLKLLKFAHLLAACCWIGGGVALAALNIHNDTAITGPVLFGINSAAATIDLWVVIIFGAYGCLLTGLVYGFFSNWGFFRHKWVTAKWLITICAILFGTFFLGEWERYMLESSKAVGLASFFDPRFLSIRSLHLSGGIFQVCLLALAVLLSVFKPWGRKKSAPDERAE